MDRTITALFDSRQDAETARQRLTAAGVSDVKITSQGAGYGDDAGGSNQSQSQMQTQGENPLTRAPDPVRDVTEGGDGHVDHDGEGHQHRGLWARIKDLFSDEDRGVYEEGLRRGHVLLTAHVQQDRADEVVRLLEGTDAIDVDKRADEWRASGWGASLAAAAGSIIPGGRSDDDKVQGIVGDDTLHHTHGDDQVRRGHDDKLSTGYSGQGGDMRSADDKAQGIVGDDTLHHTHGDDQVHKASDDRLAAAGYIGGDDERSTDDKMQGLVGDHTLHGTPGDDTLSPSTGKDLRSGDDKMQGIVGDDTLHGTHGDDTLPPSQAKDFRSGDDKMQGIVGDDTLHGTHGDDMVGGGDDKLSGRTGSDRDQVYGAQRDPAFSGSRVRSYVAGERRSFGSEPAGTGMGSTLSPGQSDDERRRRLALGGDDSVVTSGSV